MHWPSRPRTARTVLTGLGALVLSVLTGCATSAPAVLASTAGPEPSPTSSEQLLLDVPSAGSAAGRLVDGFPTNLVPVPPGAQILVSSAQPAPDGSVAISLNVRSEQDTAGLLAAVSAPLLAAGFTESPPAQPDPSLAAQASFARSGGAEYVLVGILDRNDERTMTLGGTVKP